MTAYWWLLCLLFATTPPKPASNFSLDFFQLELPITRIIGISVGGMEQQAKLFKFTTPVGWPSFLPTAELRFSRLFSEKPVNVVVELSNDEQFTPSSSIKYEDVEKIVFNGAEGGREYYVKVWSRLVGIIRPDIGPITDNARIAVVYERLYAGIPITMLPILLTMLMAFLITCWMIKPRLMELLRFQKGQPPLSNRMNGHGIH